jgi:tRNA nucleotidyltransferase (CCA-adding enzyme)
VGLEVHPDDVPEDVRWLCRTLGSRGYRAWIVGGCLRDILLGGRAADWDIATDARPEEVQAVFPRVIPTGVQHGTVTVRHRGHSYEVTTLRGEGAYTDGRRPDSVAFVSDLLQDLARRDFTINAMAYDPVGARLDDPFDGLGDLRRRLVRAVGDPVTRFSEDGLRVLRAARFTASLEFELDPATEAAIRPTLGTFQRVSAERVRDEWLKTLRARRASRGFQIMARTGILELVLPELAALHPLDLARQLTALDACAGEPVARLAALLSAGLDVQVLADWLQRFRFSNQDRERVLRIVRFTWPSLPGADATDAGLRRFAAQVGREALPTVLEVGRALANADGRETEVQEVATRFRRAVPEWAPLTVRELAVSGADVMGAIGARPGPWLGRCLDALLAAAIDDPSANTPSALLGRARDWAKENGL